MELLRVRAYAPPAGGTCRFSKPFGGPGATAEDRGKLKTQITVDKARYRGLHGSAILSRFPLENVRLQPFEHQPHDWYEEEMKSVRPLEAGKRKAGELVFVKKCNAKCVAVGE